jgi:formylmethanofuran dehydrogenase subunit A
MTADGPFEFNLHLLSGHKWSSTDIETETCGGVVPFQYKASNFVNAIQWSIGLELALLIKDPWKMFMNTDHPNGGPFIEYPRVISWLASKKARLEVLNGCHKRAQKKSLLPSIDREMSLYEIAIATRAGAAKALGFKNKGHLGVGAEADVTVYNLNPETTDIAKQPETTRKVFSSAAYTIKGGTVVVKNGKIVKVIDGKTMWANVKTDEQAEVEESMKRKFKEYYSIEYDNYPVSDHYLKVSESIPIKADV